MRLVSVHVEVNVGDRPTVTPTVTLSLPLLTSSGLSRVLVPVIHDCPRGRTLRHLEDEPQGYPDWILDSQNRRNVEVRGISRSHLNLPGTEF